MVYHHLLQRALEIDLEEIRHLAAACSTAPPAVRHLLLEIIAAETKEACLWNTMLAYCRMGAMPGYPDPGGPYGSCPPYGDCDPYQEKNG